MDECSGSNVVDRMEQRGLSSERPFDSLPIVYDVAVKWLLPEFLEKRTLIRRRCKGDRIDENCKRTNSPESQHRKRP